MTSSVHQIELISMPIDLNEYDEIVADIAEFIYRAACEAETTSRARIKKDPLATTNGKNFFDEG